MAKRPGETEEERRARKREKREKKKRRRSEADKTDESPHKNEKKKKKRHSSPPSPAAAPTKSTDETDTSHQQRVNVTELARSPKKVISLASLSRDTATLTSEDRVALENSPFRRNRVRLTVSLLPSSLKDVKKNVSRSIKSLLLRYSDRMGGVLLAFDGVQVSDGRGKSRGIGRILNEMPNIHFDVDMDALLFRPDLGMRLTGEVNESFPSHIGLLVHSYFNAMVSADDLRGAGYNFDRDAQEWRKERGDRTGSPAVIGVDDRVEFTISKLHECAGVISLEGSNPSVLA